MEAEVRQIVAFDASGAAEDISQHNLDCFCRLLPVCLLSRRRYHPYYYYDNTIAARYTDPFPYFLATHSCVVCLSEDGNQAMLLRGEDQVTGYHRHFQSLLARCYSLIQYTADPVEILESYDLCTDENGFYMVMDQPCFGRSMPTRSSAGICGPACPSTTAWPPRQTAVRAAADGGAVLHPVHPGRLERFRDTGALDDFPTSFVAPFPPEQRRLLMAAMAERIRSGDITGRLMQPGLFPDYLSMTTSSTPRGLLHHRALSPSGRLLLRADPESNLCRAFHQWLLHLPDSEAVLSGEETAAVLDELARTLT